VGEITATGEPLLFDAGGQAKILFISDETKKINKLKMDAMGFSFEGVKEQIFLIKARTHDRLHLG